MSEYEGAGEFEFGEGLFGEDVVTQGAASVPQTPPAGVLMSEGNEQIDADGRHIAIHPADEGVQLSFSVRKGTLRGNVRVGNEFADLPRVAGAKLEEEIGLRVARAYPWSRLVAAGDVKHEATIVRQPKRGEVSIVIQYRNLRLDPTRVREVTARR